MRSLFVVVALVVMDDAFVVPVARMRTTRPRAVTMVSEESSSSYGAKIAGALVLSLGLTGLVTAPLSPPAPMMIEGKTRYDRREQYVKATLEARKSGGTEAKTKILREKQLKALQAIEQQQQTPSQQTTNLISDDERLLGIALGLAPFAAIIFGIFAKVASIANRIKKKARLAMGRPN